MKQVAIVNKQDQVIGTRTISECHTHPTLIHRVVHFTLIDLKQRKVLITQRSFDVKFDSGKWCFMGEHVLLGETYDQALKKGLQDELGITLGRYHEVANHIFSYATQTEFVRFFLIEWQGEQLAPSKAEIQAVKWVTLTELSLEAKTFSDMTQHWIDVTKWETFFSSADEL